MFKYKRKTINTDAYHLNTKKNVNEIHIFIDVYVQRIHVLEIYIRTGKASIAFEKPIYLGSNKQIIYKLVDHFALCVPICCGGH